VETQFASEEQVVAQLVPVAQVKGRHDAVLALQLPSPSHFDCVSVVTEQLSVAQAVPEAYKRHAPAPLQKPSRSQLAAVSVGHSLSGSLPLAMLPHAPLAPEPFFAAEQAWHGPAHGASQQVPSTQLPVVHCEPALQAAPVAWSGRHAPVLRLHQLVATQSASTLQVVRHAVRPHTNGAQVLVAPFWHTPKPLHT
jgi:hypothetical protein